MVSIEEGRDSIRKYEYSSALKIAAVISSLIMLIIGIIIMESYLIRALSLKFILPLIISCAGFVAVANVIADLLTFSITVKDGRIFYRKYFKRGELNIENIHIHYPFSTYRHFLVFDGKQKIEIPSTLVGYNELRVYLENIAVRKSGSKLHQKLNKFSDMFWRRKIYCSVCTESFHVADIFPICPKCGNRHLGRSNLMLFSNPRANDIVLFVILILVSLLAVVVLYELFKHRILKW